MKTLNSMIFIIAVSTAISAKADPNLIAGPRLGKATASVTLASPYTNTKDPNLLAGWPKGGSRGLASHSVVSTGIKDPDVLANVKNCVMLPKTKDTPACAKHCEIAGLK